MKVSPRRRAREFALQGLYQWQMTQADADDVLKNLSELEGFKQADHAFLEAEVRGAIKEFDTWRDKLMLLADRKWEEMSPVEKAILLMGTWELHRCPDIPYRVAISEGIELAKKFGGTDGHKYVNGILDRMAALARPDEIRGKTA